MPKLSLGAEVNSLVAKFLRCRTSITLVKSVFSHFDLDLIKNIKSKYQINLTNAFALIFQYTTNIYYIHIYFHSDDDTLDLQSTQNRTDIESRNDIDPKKNLLERMQ